MMKCARVDSRCFYESTATVDIFMAVRTAAADRSSSHSPVGRPRLRNRSPRPRVSSAPDRAIGFSDHEDLTDCSSFHYLFFVAIGFLFELGHLPLNLSLNLVKPYETQ